MVRRRGCQLEMQRYYYTSDQRFEQSVDVYRPVGGGATDKDDNKLIVILVVGTAWLGHCQWIYRATSWWNAPGPQTVAAAANAPCVCVRHRGAYFQLPPLKPIVLYLLAPMSAVLVGAWVYQTTKQTSDPTTASDIRLWTYYLVFTVMALLLLVYALLKWSARGSASLDDMVHDVATAVEWVERNKSALILVEPSSSSSIVASRPPKIVFGGYSSGAHVALTLLSRPHVWQKYDLPPHKELFSGILLVSGVLAVQPIDLDDDEIKKSGNNTPETRSSDGDSDDIGVTETTASNSSFSSDDTTKDASSSYATTSTQSNKTNQQQHSNNNGNKNRSKKISSAPPVWLVNLVMRAVWGPDWASTIPSPVKTASTSASSTLPHLVIQNRHEVFGLPWLDVFFCAQQYCELLRQRHVPNIFCEVNSDHWFVLASRQLYEAVQEQVPQLLNLASASADCNGTATIPTSRSGGSSNQQANVRKQLEAE